jgi:hypothetical protein
VTGRGVYWSTSSGSAITNSKTSNGSGTGQYVSNITGLTAGTVYYMHSYATNSAGTGYGNQLSFTTAAASTPTPPPTKLGSFANFSGVDHLSPDITV